MWVLVQFVHLFPPVKVISPVRDHLLKVVGVEAVVKLAVLQRGNRTGLVHPPVQILGDNRDNRKREDRMKIWRRYCGVLGAFD